MHKAIIIPRTRWAGIIFAIICSIASSIIRWLILFKTFIEVKKTLIIWEINSLDHLINLGHIREICIVKHLLPKYLLVKIVNSDYILCYVSYNLQCDICIIVWLIVHQFPKHSLLVSVKGLSHVNFS